MNNLPKDLFSDTTMSFGDHLEALRSHLWKALAGVALGCIVCLFFGTEIVKVIRWPLDQALAASNKKFVDDTGKNPIPIFWAKIWGEELPKTEPPKNTDGTETPQAVAPPNEATGVLAVEINTGDLVAQLKRVLPGQIPELPADALSTPITIQLKSPEIQQFQQAVLDSKKPVALSPQEPFMIYLKVSGLAGLVLASPWVFYQVWLFISAGLYMHERKHMYAFGTLSLVLFIMGILFCFRLVLPLVLKFFLTYNDYLNIKLEPRLSEYLSLASMMPLMFGIGFQLPLIMVFLERMNIVSIQVFIEKWRIAVFAISFISMIFTPPEPISMMLMMGPMVTLYFLGILLCKWTSNKREVAPVPSV